MHVIGKAAHDAGRAIGRHFACVTVKVIGKKIVQVEPSSIGILKYDTLVTPLPADVRVVGPDGKEIKAAHRFYITTETFDPFHALTDLPTERQP